MEPPSTTSNAATSTIYNHPRRLFCAAGAGGSGGTAGTGRPGVWDGDKGPAGAVGIVLLAGSAEGDDAVSTVGISISACAGVCIIGVICKTGVEDEMTCGGGRTGVLLPATNEGTEGAFDDDGCWLGWPGYAGLFIISEELLILLWDELPVLSDERA